MEFKKNPACLIVGNLKVRCSIFENTEPASMIDPIIEGVFISDATSVISQRGKNKMKELNIQKVLTCSAMPIKKNDQLPGVDYKFVFMMDMVSQDILGNGLLEECLRYITNSVKEGTNVLVHCEVGISRSVTVVAAYVMRHFHWTAEKAIMFIQKARPIACPNQSFIQQLSIFEQMGYRADTRALTHSQLYRNYCADTGNIPAIGTASAMLAAKISSKTESIVRLRKALPRLAALSRSRVVSNSSGTMESTNPTSSREPPSTDTASSFNGYHPAITNSKPSVLNPLLDDLEDPEQMAQQTFRCRKCRQQLFYDFHIMHHTEGGFNQAKQQHPTTSFCDFEYLLMPMKWMSTSEFQGKINCPKCGDKLGQYIWGGRVCLGNGEDKQCGAFVAPWIHIQKCKVDMSIIGGNSGVKTSLEAPFARMTTYSSQPTQNERERVVPKVVINNNTLNSNQY